MLIDIEKITQASTDCTVRFSLESKKLISIYSKNLTSQFLLIDLNIKLDRLESGNICIQTYLLHFSF